MAPAEVRNPIIPDTLPEDFADWDGAAEQKPAAAPVKKAPFESARPAETRIITPAKVAAPAPKVERPMPQPVVRAAKAVAPAAKQSVVEVPRQPAPPIRQQSTAVRFDYAPPSTSRSAEARLNESLWSGVEDEEAESKSSGRVFRTVAIAVGAVVVCAALGAGYWFYSARSHSQPVADASTVKTAAPAMQADLKPDPRNGISDGKNGNNTSAQMQPSQQQSAGQSSSSSAQPAADTPSSAASQPAATPSVNLALFTGQSKIPHNQLSQGQGGPEPTGNLDASRMNDNSGAANPLLSSSNKNHVQFVPGKPIAVSSGVLSGMLLKKTVPEYPRIALQTRVSGTVTVAVVITPQGTVSEARAISGPILLRQAAVDAVKGWRYRPYLVDNQPVAVETNVNVDFSLQ